MDLARRAETEMKAAGLEEVQLEVVQGEGHMFDHLQDVGTMDTGPKWKAVLKGLDWLKSFV